jgi:hypothetical protein
VAEAARQSGVRGIERLFARSEEDLDRDRAFARERSGVEVADLNNYYLVLLDEGADRGRVAASWLGLAPVETAYFEGIATEACTDIAPVTALYTNRQTYLDPARAESMPASWNVSLRGLRRHRDPQLPACPHRSTTARQCSARSWAAMARSVSGIASITAHGQLGQRAEHRRRLRPGELLDPERFTTEIHAKPAMARPASAIRSPGVPRSGDYFDAIHTHTARASWS